MGSMPQLGSNACGLYKFNFRLSASKNCSNSSDIHQDYKSIETGKCKRSKKRNSFKFHGNRK